jgi:tRNA(adenine34) deaminase
MKSALCIGGLDSGGARGIGRAAAALGLHGVRPLSALTAVVTSGRRGPSAVEWTRGEVLEGMIDAAVALGARVASVEPPLNSEQIGLIARKASEHGLTLVVDTSWRGPDHQPLLDGDAERVLLDVLLPEAKLAIVDPAFLQRSALGGEEVMFGVLPLMNVWCTGEGDQLLAIEPDEHTISGTPKRRPAGFSAVRTAAVTARLALGEEDLAGVCQRAQAFALAASAEGTLPEGESRRLVGLGGPATRAAALAGSHAGDAPLVDDERFMRLALEQAAVAGEAGDVPVGAVLVHDGKVIASAHNRREADGDPVAHAEILALQAGARARGSWRLSECTLYVTLEPCFMCAGALVNARLSRLVVGTLDAKAGATHSLAEVATDPRLNHRVAVCAGVCQRECTEQLRAFFAARR